MKTEDLYISLYEGFRPTAEYLQANSREYRYLLGEAAIIVGLSFALRAFAESFFGSLGESVAAPLTTRIRAKLKKSEKGGDRKAMLKALELMGPYLKHLDAMTEGQRAVYRSAVAAALSTLGYPRDVADDTATEVMTRLVAAGEARAE